MSAGIAPPIPHWNAPFLDGVRGAAVAMVVWQHSDEFRTVFLKTNEPNPGGTLPDLGELGVQLFFILSAFLLTYLSVVEWENFIFGRGKVAARNDNDNENNNNNKYSQLNEDSAPLLGDQKSNNNNNNESSGSSGSDGSSLSSVGSPSSVGSSWLSNEGVKIWFRYFVRRIFRIWPPYVLVLFIVAVIPLQMFHKGKEMTLSAEDFFKHIFLLEGYAVFWTIPLECCYYFIIPFIVMMYVGVQQLSLAISPSFSLYPSRVIGLLILVGFHTAYLFYDRYTDDHPAEFSPPSWEKHYFTTGSFFALIFFEWKRSGLLPMTVEEEKKFNQTNGITPTKVLWDFVTVPSRSAVYRTICSLLASFCLILFLAELPHWAPMIYGIKATETGDLLINLSGIPAAFMLIFLEASNNAILKSIFETMIFRTLGKWSFSIYLIHIFVFDQIVPIMKPLPATFPDRGLQAIDFWLLSIFLIGLVSFVWHNIVEVPSINAGSWIIKRYAPRDSSKHED